MASSLSPEHRARLADIVGRMEAAGEPPENIQTAVDGYKAKYSAPEAAAVDGGGTPPATQALLGGFMGALPGGTPGVNRAGSERILSGLPGVGGAVGGAVGGGAGPISVGGAAVGGGAGEALRQALSGKKIDPASIGLSGAEQGATQAVGGVLAKGASKIALPAMRRGLGGVASIAKRFDTTSENVARTVLKGRYPITEPGERAAGAAGKAVRGERSAALTKAVGSVSASDISSIAIRKAEKNLGRALTPGERKFIVAMVRDESNEALTNATYGAVKRAPKRYGMTDVEKIKEVAANNASPDYRAAQAGKSVSADPSLSQDIASGARRQLEKKVPGIRGMNQQIKESMISEQAISGALEKGTGEYTPIHIGPLSVGLRVPREKLGNLALWLDDPQTHELMRQSPRAFSEMIKQLIHSEEPDATSGR